MCLIKTVVIKPTLNCNLRCEYCYELLRSKTGSKSSNKYLKVEQLESIIDRFAALFPNSKILWMLHGGEPLILGTNYYQKLCSHIREVNINHNLDYKIALQTNGSSIDENWIKTLEENADLMSERIVSVSIDGPKNLNDLTRHDIYQKSSYNDVMKSIHLLQKSKLNFTTITVVGEHNVNNADECYCFIRDLSPNLAKFIPCYNYNEIGKAENYGINPIKFAEFLCNIFDLWVKDLPSFTDKWFVIDPIATIISNLVNTKVTWCEYRDSKCDNFIAIYPNGDMWLCDTFNQETMKEQAFLGNILNLSDIELVHTIKDPCSKCSYSSFYKTATANCFNCDLSKICHGGCIANRIELLRKSPQLFKDYCEAKHILINHIKRGIVCALSKSKNNL